MLLIFEWIIIIINNNNNITNNNIIFIINNNKNTNAIIIIIIMHNCDFLMQHLYIITKKQHVYVNIESIITIINIHNTH